MSHITGGGIPENLPRCMSSDFIPYIDKKSWKIPVLFEFLKGVGQIPEKDFWNTFNLGVGFCLIVNPKNFKILSNTTNEQKQIVIKQETKIKIILIILNNNNDNTDNNK